MEQEQKEALALALQLFEIVKGVPVSVRDAAGDILMHMTALQERTAQHA